jgi:hypothetical protein
VFVLVGVDGVLWCSVLCVLVPMGFSLGSKAAGA